jgi:hypothetical protein
MKWIEGRERKKFGMLAEYGNCEDTEAETGHRNGE